MPGPWEKYQAGGAAAPEAKPWDKYKRPEPETPMVESALRGLNQGITMGFADEIIGAKRAVGDTLFGDTKIADFVKKYREERDALRAGSEKAREDHPYAYSAGEMGGTVGTAFIPGVGVAGKGLGAGLKGAAIQGGVMGAGLSNADLTQGDVGGFAEDTALGAGVGALTHGAVTGLGAAAKQLTPTNLAKKATNVFLGAPEAATERYIQNPAAVKAAKPLSGVADELTNSIAGLKNDVIQGSAASRAALKAEGTNYTGREVADIFQKKMDDIAARAEGVLDPQDEAAVKFLGTMRDRYAGVDKISANRLKDTIQKIDKVTEWEGAPGQIVKFDDAVKKEVRSGLDDLLKTASPGYREQMKEVAGNAQLLDKFAEKTANKDTLTNHLRSLGRGKKDFALEDLKAYDKARGTNFAEAIKDSLTKETFDKSATNGSRNVNLYRTLADFGESTNIPLGKQAGAIIGAGVDKYGPKIAMKALDTATAVNNIWNQNPQIGAVKDLLAPVVKYASKGDPGAVLTFQLLSQSNPDLMNQVQASNQPQGLNYPGRPSGLVLPGR